MGVQSDHYRTWVCSLTTTQLPSPTLHKGLFKYSRLPFGVSSAPAIFQRCMESLLREQKGAAVYIDNILVTGGYTEEHLHSVMGILESANL